MNISIELIPRCQQTLEQTLQSIQQQLPAVNTINIPDLRRLQMRSWQGCEIAQRYFTDTVPHLRAADFESADVPTLSNALDQQDAQHVLVVSGDPLPGQTPKMNSIELIAQLKHLRPQRTVYAALDPYRQDFQSEVAYARQKVAAGADGFFTQPFFDVRLMEIYADLLPDVEIYWGVAPVLTDKSRRYWEKRNKAIFPPSFNTTLAWQRAFARDALQFASARRGHVYFMPIKVNLFDYLGQIV